MPLCLANAYIYAILHQSTDMVEFGEDELLKELDGKSNKELDDLDGYYSRQAEAARGPRSDAFLDDVMADFSRKQVKVNLAKMARAGKIHNERSRAARVSDERQKAPTTGSVVEWSRSPERLDFPDVDTPMTGFQAPENPPATDYERRVRELEAEGLTRSDAQGVADAERL